MIIEDVIKIVEKTHPKLGNLFAFMLLSSHTRTTTIVVGVPSTGKTTVNNALAKIFPNALYEEGLTLSSFRHKTQQLNGFNGLLIIDDISKIDTPYSRRGTLTALCGLAYDGHTSKGVERYYFRIENFNGSVIVGLQPQMMKELVVDPRWETVVRDKSIRYYHLFFPTKPNYNEIDVKEISEIIPSPKVVKESVDLNELKDRESFKKLFVNFEIQSSPARSIQKVQRMLSAMEYIEGKKVDDEMINTLERITKPMLLEPVLLIKGDFEEHKVFHNNLFYLFTAMMSLNDTNLKNFYKIWGVTEQYLRRIIEYYGEYFYVYENVVYPTDKFNTLRSVIDPYV